MQIYDLRTNKHFTLKTSTLAYKDLEDFVACYNPKNRHERKETERFKPFIYSELMQRDKANLDIFWLKDESLEDTDNLPAPAVLAAKIAENLESALERWAKYDEITIAGAQIHFFRKPKRLGGVQIQVDKSQ
jgi:type I restriction enzyme M protein